MKIIHIISGGLDSTMLLYKLLSEGHQVKCLSFNYNQRHKRELECAKKTCAHLGVEYKVVDISSITELISNSALTSDMPVPQGHYEDSNMRQTVVPSRNTIMLAIANGYAVNNDFDAVSIGVHSGDHMIYPDCRPEFIGMIEELFKYNNYKSIKVHTPFLGINKAEIVEEGLKLKVDFNLTYTCYNGEEIACGKCGSCQERLEAFRLNHQEDPIQYESREIIKKEYANNNQTTSSENRGESGESWAEGYSNASRENVQGSI